MDKPFDILIIGSGLGGLVCGAILSKEGYKVCILEKNQQIGGCLQTFVRNRVIFDSGVHYLGGLAPGQNLHQIFKYLGIMDKLRIQQLNKDAFDTILFEDDDKAYPLAQGYDNFIAKLSADFPGEEAAIQTYCDKIRDICARFPFYNLKAEGSESEKEAVLTISARDYIESLTENKRLRQVLAGNNALYAGIPHKSPFFVHALVLNHYIESAWRCLDGGSQIGKYLARVIRDHSGEIIRHSEVSRLVEEGGKIVFAELTNGKRFYAQHFISNVHPAKTIQMTESSLLRRPYRQRLQSLENTISSFTVNIVLKKGTFPYQKTNYYYHTPNSVWYGWDYTEENWPLNYALFFTASSRDSAYADGLNILTYMHFNEVKDWAHTFNTVSVRNQRGENYETFKIRKAEAVLDLVEKKFPNIRDCIDRYYTTTPLSYRDYIGNNDGSMYGILKDYSNPLQSLISPRTKIPNLFFTGQNMVLHGILGVSISALVTSAVFIDGETLINRIRNA